jgi:hypothetical protein
MSGKGGCISAMRPTVRFKVDAQQLKFSRIILSALAVRFGKPIAEAVWKL